MLSFESWPATASMEDEMKDGGSLYSSKCLVSSSCVPRCEGYSRIHICGGSGGSNCHRTRRFWRRFVKRLVREGRSIYGSKPVTFQYDAVSYSQNFDEGCHNNDF
ncbi:hypothetical protein Ancab_003623 [Ancistrocladus abbreviatus]